MDDGVAAIAVMLIGGIGLIATWLAGAIIFGAFVGGMIFSAVGVHTISEAF